MALIHRLSTPDCSSIGLVEAIVSSSSSPVITLVSVIRSLQETPGQLDRINALASCLGVAFHLHEGQLLHRKLNQEGGPLRPLELASDGTIHALMLFYALTSDADNFFLDEPGSKLHPSFHAKLRAQLAALAAQGRSVFVITHTPSLISPEHDRLLHFSRSPAGTHVVPLHQSRTIYEHAKFLSTGATSSSPSLSFSSRGRPSTASSPPCSEPPTRRRGWAPS
jgi:ABC-type glutathione transport system ATPase component